MHRLLLPLNDDLSTLLSHFDNFTFAFVIYHGYPNDWGSKTTLHQNRHHLDRHHPSLLLRTHPQHLALSCHSQYFESAQLSSSAFFWCASSAAALRFESASPSSLPLALCPPPLRRLLLRVRRRGGQVSLVEGALQGNPHDASVVGRAQGMEGQEASRRCRGNQGCGCHQGCRERFGRILKRCCRVLKRCCRAEPVGQRTRR